MTTEVAARAPLITRGKIMVWSAAAVVVLLLALGALIAVENADLARLFQTNWRSGDPIIQGFSIALTVALLAFYVAAMISVRESAIAMIGLTLVMIWLVIAVAAPLFPIPDPNATSRDILVSAFSDETIRGRPTRSGDWYLLGTDKTGRSMLARVVWGTQRVLLWAVTATMVAYAVGALLGVAAGYLGGWWDEVISFICNVMLSFPVMVMYILIITYLGQSGVNVIIAVTFASGPGIMRIVRGLTLDLKTRDYIAAAQTRGESSFYIMLIELLPNARGPLIVDACLRLGYTIIAIATLGFLGLGLPPPDPDWGAMLQEGSGRIAQLQQSKLLIPAVAVSSLILGFNLLADGLRDMSLRD